MHTHIYTYIPHSTSQLTKTASYPCAPLQLPQNFDPVQKAESCRADTTISGLKNLSSRRSLNNSRIQYCPCRRLVGYQDLIEILRAHTVSKWDHELYSIIGMRYYHYCMQCHMRGHNARCADFQSRWQSGRRMELVDGELGVVGFESPFDDWDLGDEDTWRFLGLERKLGIWLVWWWWWMRRGRRMEGDREGYI